MVGVVRGSVMRPRPGARALARWIPLVILFALSRRAAAEEPLPIAATASSGPSVATPVPEEPREIALRGLHLQYGIGGAFGHERAQPGLRHNLDAGVLFGAWRPRAAQSYHSAGFLFGAAMATGFLSWPTYGLGEVGYGETEGTAGYAIVAGPAVRAAPTVGGGATVRGAIWAWGVDVGARAVLVAGPYPEVQLTLLLGIGVN